VGNMTFLTGFHLTGFHPNVHQNLKLKVLWIHNALAKIHHNVGVKTVILIDPKIYTKTTLVTVIVWITGMNKLHFILKE
jgi:hypothetical protein